MRAVIPARLRSRAKASASRSWSLVVTRTMGMWAVVGSLEMVRVAWSRALPDGYLAGLSFVRE